jgi:4-hydroxybutyryl-CoA dehydratase/vinylacetyl-CoA-Delta-isomerase
MRTKQDYIKGLAKMKRNVYHDGQLIDRTDELQMDCLNTIGTTYDEAARPENQELCTAISHLTGERINRFTHIHQNKEDLHRKQDMTRMLCQKVGGCIQRCMGIDGTNAIYNVSYEADKLNNGATQYHENFKKWLTRFQTEDLIGCCAQTDVKGDRMLRPADQPNPGAYVRIKERLKDGIVVEGCKVHISEASVADEVLVLPTRALRAEDKDYAVGFAVPGDWEGLKQVVTIHNLRPRDHFKRGVVPGATDSYMIFENCFVPWERVFLAGEHQHGGVLALLFALFHRHSYSGCKPAIGDVIMGTAALAAEVNNIHKQSHVREKLAELIMTTELGYAAGYTASDLGKPEVYIPGIGFVPYGPGSYIPNSIYCNVGRCLSGEAVWRESEILCDVPPREGFQESGDRGGAPQVHQAEPEHVGRGSGPVLEIFGRSSLLGDGRYNERGQLPRRRLTDYGTDRHHDPVRYRIPENTGEIYRRHERWRPRRIKQEDHNGKKIKFAGYKDGRKGG